MRGFFGGLEKTESKLVVMCEGMQLQDYSQRCSTTLRSSEILCERSPLGKSHKSVEYRGFLDSREKTESASLRRRHGIHSG
jgi:hypothetical protein